MEAADEAATHDSDPYRSARALHALHGRQSPGRRTRSRARSVARHRTPVMSPRDGCRSRSEKVGWSIAGKHSTTGQLRRGWGVARGGGAARRLCSGRGLFSSKEAWQLGQRVRRPRQRWRKISPKGLNCGAKWRIVSSKWSEVERDSPEVRTCISANTGIRWTRRGGSSCPSSSVMRCEAVA